MKGDDEEDAVKKLVNAYPSMAEIMEMYPAVFREFLITTGVHLAQGQRRYASFRSIVETIVSLFDMSTPTQAYRSLVALAVIQVVAFLSLMACIEPF